MAVRAGPEGRQRVAHGVRRCEEIGERQKYALAVILSEAKNLARSSFAISHFHRQCEIVRFAQDDRLADSFTPSEPWVAVRRSNSQPRKGRQTGCGSLFRPFGGVPG